MVDLYSHISSHSHSQVHTLVQTPQILLTVFPFLFPLSRYHAWLKRYKAGEVEETKNKKEKDWRQENIIRYMLLSESRETKKKESLVEKRQ